MLKMDDFEVCRRLRLNSTISNVPVIFITAMSEVSDETLEFRVVVSDFIHTPISAPIVSARVRKHLKIKLTQNYLLKENEKLKDRVQQPSTELERLREFVRPSTSSKH